MNSNKKKYKAEPFKASIADCIYSDYINGLKHFNGKLQIIKDESGEALKLEDNPMQMSYNAGELGAMRAILIKYYGYKLEDLESREKWELEHDEEV